MGKSNTGLDVQAQHTQVPAGRKFGRWLVAASLALASACAWPAYTVKVEVSMPKGSAGEKLTANLPVSSKLSPCSDTTKLDAISIKLTYDVTNAKKVVDRDLYVFLYNAENDPKYLMLLSPSISLSNGGMFRAYGSIADMDRPLVRDVDVYLPREKNFLGTSTIDLFPGGVRVDGVLAGTWQFIAVIGDRASATFSLDDPDTWDAWDVGTVMFGRPWVGKVPGRVCR